MEVVGITMKPCGRDLTPTILFFFCCLIRVVETRKYGLRSPPLSHSQGCLSTSVVVEGCFSITWLRRVRRATESVVIGRRKLYVSLGRSYLVWSFPFEFPQVSLSFYPFALIVRLGGVYKVPISFHEQLRPSPTS